MTAVKKNQVIILKRPGENSERVHLGDELKSGGAGFVYSIKDDSGRVIKIYRPETLLSEGTTYQEKIECMLGNVPNVSKISSGDGAIVQLAWPLASAYTMHGEFVGFAMPMVDMQSTTELEYVLSHKQAEKEGLPHHLGVGVSLAHNLAAVVSSIHALGHAIVDLKPVNLKFYIKEFYVAVLDCDGFYINVPGKTSSAPQTTPDYLAPEFQNAPITKPEHQDRFALAVIIFKLLNFGIHPYAGVPIKGAKIPSDLEEKIKAYLYPYGIVPHKKVSPVPASTHETFPAELRALFDRAFGGSPSDRPKATEWAGMLKKYAEKSKGLLEHCTHQHLHFKDMHCATCLREQILSGARAKHDPSKPFSPASTSHAPPAPQLQVTPPQPQISATSLSGNLQQVVTPPPLAVFPRERVIYITLIILFALSTAAVIAGFSWAFYLSTILIFPFTERSKGIVVRTLIAAFFAAICAAILWVIWSLVQHNWESILKYAAVSFIALALIYTFLGKLSSSVKQRIGISALLFGGLWAWGPSFNDLKGEWDVLLNLIQEKRNFAGHPPVPVAVQQVGEKQKSTQGNTANSDTVQKAVGDAPVAQDTTSRSITWSDTWPKAAPLAIAPNRDTLPTHADAPVAQDTTSQSKTWSKGWPNAALYERDSGNVQESINSGNSSNSDSIPAAGSSTEQANKNVSGSRGWLGLDAHPLTLDSASSMSQGLAQRGMIIANIAQGGPADIAGMVVGDLLVSVDNKAVDTNEAIRDVLSNISVGRTVPIKIIRNGKEMYLLLTITQRL